MDDLKIFLRKAKEIQMTCLINECYGCIYFNENDDSCVFEEVFGMGSEFPYNWNCEVNDNHE